MDKKNHLLYCVSCVCDINVFKCKPRDYSVFPWVRCIGAFSHTPHISVLEYWWHHWWLQRTEFFVVKRQTLLNVGLKDEAILWKRHFLGHFLLIYKFFGGHSKLICLCFFATFYDLHPLKTSIISFPNQKTWMEFVWKSFCWWWMITGSIWVFSATAHALFGASNICTENSWLFEYNHTHSIWSYKYMYRE